MIKAVIVDDERASRQVISEIISASCPDILIIGEAGTTKDAVRILNDLKPELIFLDIQLPDGTGFDVLENIHEPEFEIIFITAYDNFAINAIKYSALDYILKPVNPVELIQAIEKYKSRISPGFLSKRLQILLENIKTEKPKKNKIVLSTAEGYHIIQIDDIIRCQSDSYYTNFYLINGKRIIVSKTLKEYEEMLAETDFIRPHKSHLINMKYIKSYIKADGGYIVMTDGEEIPVSRRKKEYITDVLNKL